jgi:hypothetical protein
MRRTNGDEEEGANRIRLPRSGSVTNERGSEQKHQESDRTIHSLSTSPTSTRDGEDTSQLDQNSDQASYRSTTTTTYISCSVHMQQEETLSEPEKYYYYYYYHHHHRIIELRYWDSISDGTGHFSFRYRFQTGPGAHPVS